MNKYNQWFLIRKAGRYPYQKDLILYFAGVAGKVQLYLTLPKFLKKRSKTVFPVAKYDQPLLEYGMTYFAAKKLKNH